MGLFRKRKPGKYTNRKGTSFTVDSGGIHVDVDELLKSPEVQRQLQGVDRLFKQTTIMALRTGSEPPHMVGKGIYTKKSLLRDWDDDWQAALEEMNEFIEITYNSFFDISEEHPPTTDFLTADEIVKQYGET